MLLRIVFTMFLVALAGSSAFAEDAYLDNRSSAADLVRSLYNAINHHEYAGAYDYFASPPAKDFATFQAGYDHTVRVDVITGDVTGDGAAGSTYFTVPTAIKATDDKGRSKVFIGCYTVKAVNGAIQEPPFRPFIVEKGALKPGKDDDFAVYGLPKCGDAAPDNNTATATIDDAKARFVAEQDGHCQKVEETRGGINEPHQYKIKYKQAGSAANDPLTEVSLFVFDCTMAAYNETQVFYLSDTSGNQLNLLSFSEPHLDLKYVDEDSKTLKSMAVDGFTASHELTNSDYDEATNTITSFAKWRGIGDASSQGTWGFVDGQFVLKDYDVDPTYDEEQNPVSIMKNGNLIK
jgi:hypothetical protein